MQTFQDIFKKSFLAGADAQITPLGIVLVMVLSLAVSAFIFIIYKKCYRGVLYSYNFNVAVALMTVITAMIIATISSNIVLSLGMVGALSIVRFRTAIKDPIDLIFLFWAVAAGIGIGARAYWIVLFGNLAVGLTFMLLSAFKRERKVYLLVVRCRTDASKEVMDFLAGYKHTLRSKTTRRETTEMTVELQLKDEDARFVDALGQLRNVENVSLIAYNGDFAQ